MGEDLGGRQSWNVTLLLAVFALKFASAGAVPNVPYLTMYDKKLVCSWFTIFFVTSLQHVNFYYRESDVAERLEQISRWLGIGWVLVQNLWYWATAFRLVRERPAENIACVEN